ncbi:hypothetical protein K438DRAFT_325313 [Mycena galopus ATCC 62051]|nr:hypothetical protein K438DRAFT_325313 [Mycena galopus ATCC 62051]
MWFQAYVIALVVATAEPRGRRAMTPRGRCEGAHYCCKVAGLERKYKSACISSRSSRRKIPKKLREILVFLAVSLNYHYHYNFLTRPARRMDPRARLDTGFIPFFCQNVSS